MFDMGKSRFYKKSKQLLKLLKTRIDTIRKKRNAVHKYLKNDIADLLRSGLEVNAYGRAEGLLVELNMSSCYDFIEQCITCIFSHLSAMENQRECPSECREAIPSLMHAAARFADLPELRDLRTLFTERYGTSLEPFINKEFVEKLRSGHPAKEKKLQLMQEIAQENSIQWDPMSLEQKMFKPPPPAQDKPKHGSSHGSEDKRGNQHKRKDDALPARDGQNGGNKMSVMTGYDVPKGNEKDFVYRVRKVIPDDSYNLPHSSDDEVVSSYRGDSTSQDSRQNSSSSIGSFSEDEVGSRKPLYYGSRPPPYVKQNVAKEGRTIEDTILKDYEDDQIDEEEKKLDQLLMCYSKKKPPHESSRVRANHYPPPGQESDDTSRATKHGARANLYSPSAHEKDNYSEATRRINARVTLYPPLGQESDYANGVARARHRSGRANLNHPPGQQYEETSGASRQRNARPELPDPPARATSFPLEQAAAHEATKGHARAMSLQPDMLNCPGHVHPKLPDYDDLAARLAALRGQ